VALPRKNFSRRTKPSFTEQAVAKGLQGKTDPRMASVMDYFTNAPARMGFGTPSLAEGASYELIRFSYDYWMLITLYRNHWISRRIIDTPANDMVKAWPKLTSDITPEDITKVDRVIRRTGTKAQMLTAMKWARLFGGAGALIAIKGHEKELDQPLDLDTVEIGGYQGLIPFDRWAGINPDGEICTDMGRPLDFSKPEYYSVRANGGESFRVHSTRILRFLGPTVPTPEVEAQTWWGISVLEPIYEAIRKLDNMSWNILSLTFRANILGMKFPDLASLLSGLGSSQKASQNFETRMSAVNHLISNQSLVPLPAEGSIESTAYTFGGLSDVYQQFQLDLSGGSGIPVTRLWGRTITGLGQSNDADERIYEEKIAQDQSTDMVPQLEKLYPVVCMSELGEVPDDLDLTCPSVRVLDEKEKAELAKSVADTVTVYMNGGIMSPQIGAKEVKQSSDATGIGTNLTDEFIATLSNKVQSEGELGEGLFGEESGGEPQLEAASGPQKVLREMGKEKQEQEPAPTSKVKGKAADSDGAGPEREVHGFKVVIETPKGYPRHGLTPDGKKWSQVLPYDYGYFKGIEGADGDSLDIALGDDPSSDWVYVFDQSTLGKKASFDESKVFMNFATQGDALRAFKAGHHKAEEVFMDFTPMPIGEFKAWLASANLHQPCGDELTGTLPV
jgi:phage-related protein (TIGR01555 family)